jgi:hypothetical protein
VRCGQDQVARRVATAHACRPAVVGSYPLRVLLDPVHARLRLGGSQRPDHQIDQAVVALP